MITNTNTREQKLAYLDRIESKVDLNDYFDVSYETDYLLEYEMAHDDFRAGIMKAFNEFMSTNHILPFLTYLREVRKSL